MDGILSLTVPYFYLIHVLIVVVRVSATLLFAPIWGAQGFPQYLKIVLVFSIGAVLASVVPYNEQAYLHPGLVLPTEFLIGLLLSMGVRIAFAGLQFGAQMLSTNLGFSMAQTIDPTTANRSTLISGYLSMLGYVLILVSDQHHTLLRTLAASYTAFPVGTIVQPGQWFDTLMHAAGQIFVMGWRIALPVFVAMLLLDLTTAFIAKMHPQITLMVLTTPLKVYVGFIVLGASLMFIPRAFMDAFNLVVLSK